MSEMSRLLLSAFLLAFAKCCCVDNCNGHGSCNAHCQCICHKGYIGGDCSQLICPYGRAWVDQAVEIDVAHKQAECSNMGHCDRGTGMCTCFEGFDGAACDRIMCNTDCNGHGRCVSMAEYAKMKDPGREATFISCLFEARQPGPYLFYADITPTNVYTYEDVWDAHMMHGCVCDRGYHGPDCLLRDCPRGDDPLTGTIQDKNGVQFDEKQEIMCKATKGSFTLSFRKMTTEPINFDDRVEVMTAKINALESTNGVVISYSGITTTACTSLGNIITISFPQDFGDLPLLVPDGRKLEHGTFPIELPRLEITEVRKGDKENAFCSNRGVCDTSTGICTCSDNFDTSDGKGRKGTAAHNRGDCGHATGSITACPGEVSCSAHGVCLGPPTYQCQCSSGWIGGDCSEKACPTHTSFFDEPIENGIAHSATECSSVGTCDRTKGECECPDLFTDGQTNLNPNVEIRAKCAEIKCPGSPACSGHGKCMTIQQLALYTEFNGDATEFTYGAVPRKRETWDNQKMMGCLCDAGYEGYDCSLFSCPKGDDPRLTSGAFERSAITCTGSSGGLSVRFRQRITPSLSYLTTEAELKAALEALSSIGTVHVEFSKKTAEVKAAEAAGKVGDDLKEVVKEHDKFCTVDGSNTAIITFLSELGDLPAVTVVEDGVDKASVDSDGRGLSAKGSKQNAECSGRGLCAYSVGVCKCFEGFGSSDGNGGEGERNDCGFIETQYTGSATELHNTS